MEFERALFRIHQKALLTEPLRRFRLKLEAILPAFIAVQVVVLATLHCYYVGRSTCLPDVFRHAGLWNDTVAEPMLPEDSLIRLTLSNGDGLIGMTLMEHRAPMAEGALASDGFQVKEENRSSVGRRRFDAKSIFGSYRFALDRELVQMRKSVFEKHHFPVHNVSISSSCLVPFGPLADAFHVFDAWDGLVINELAYGLRSRGYLERMDEDNVVEAWAWTEDQVESPLQGSFLFAFFRKNMLLLSALLSFCLISAITGLFIRIAVHGSAVLMFPLALTAQYFGMSNSRMSLNVLARSFPWIGIHVDVLRTGGRRMWPLFRSHMLFLLIQSFAYLSCNLAWRFLVYRKSSPEGFEENIFSLCSIVELFNLIFVRSVQSASLYPKVVTASMVYLHFYIFCSLYPFHNLAFIACCSLCCYAMVYCLNHYEEPALRADPFSHNTPTSAHPRALYLPMLSPSWTMEAAPLWTMFYPAEPGGTFPEDAMRHIQSEEYNMA